MDLIRRLLGEKNGGRLERLSTLAFIVSLAHFTMMWLAFIWSRGKEPDDIYPVPMAMILLYFGSLLIYVPVKETLRWKQKKRYVSRRAGEVFIIMWVVSMVIMGWMEWTTEGYFRLPEGMWETVVGALSIGGISSLSKGLHDCRNGVCPDDESGEDKEDEAQEKTA